MADGSVIIETKLDDSGVKKGVNNLDGSFSKLGNIAGKALKGVAVVTGAVAVAFGSLVTASVNARGEIEQQIGGVETLFKNNADKVIKNAENAYKTAGMSASDYMKTVTSFSASLLQSLGGDTAKAADVADMALTDMSDNANKFGTSMEAIQNAYQGFAKQNYTMLDNLKLGYGGTKTEMQRLLSDAQKLTGVKYDINNLSDVYNAIHAVQEELGVTGTTAKEASSTLQGSFASMKASWDNFLSGSGDLSQLLDTVKDVIGNIVRLVNEAIPDIIGSITESLPEFAKLGGETLTQLINGISSHMPALMGAVVEVVQTLVQTFLENLPQLIEMGIQVITQLMIGIAEMLPELIPQIIDCVMLIMETLLDNIDLLIDAGIQLILALADGLIEAVPRLIEKIPVIIEKLFNALIRNFPKIVQAGGQLIGKLIVGIIGALGTLLSKAPEIISTLVKGIKNGWATIKNAGKNLIQGLWEGISGSITWLKNKIKGWVGNVTSFIKNLFGIHSPSTLFRDEIGQYLGLGLGEGFEDSLSGVYKDMQKAVDYENAKLSSNLTTSHLMKLTNEDNRQARLESIDNNREVVVNSRLDVDGKEMASVVNRVNAKQRLQYGIA
jgi:phage-related protein